VLPDGTLKNPEKSRIYFWKSGKESRKVFEGYFQLLKIFFFSLTLSMTLSSLPTKHTPIRKRR
jgi:hypothetical protein